MKKILFPTDFSEAAHHAYRYALHVAKSINGELVTVHSYLKPDLGEVHLPNTVREVYESIEMEQFEDYKSSIPKLDSIAIEEGCQEVVVRHTLVEGEAVRSILRAAKKEKADFIIMGTNGAGWLEEIFIGSVAGEILENSEVPVVAIPRKATFDGKLGKFVFMTSYKTEEMTALRKLIDFATWFDADIEVVNVDLNSTEAFKQGMLDLKTHFAGVDGLNFSVVEGDEILPTVTAFAEAKKADLIALVSHKRNFFEELFRFSHAKKLSYHSDLPILSLPAKSLVS